MSAFENTNCCGYNSGVLATQVSDYYATVKEKLGVYIDKAYQAERFGGDANVIYNRINDFHYLLLLLIIISDEMKQDSDISSFINDGCPNNLGIDYYVEKYNLSCIQKHFFCSGLGFDISSLMNIFGLNINNQEQDGIGYMHIEYNRTDLCQGNINIFRVR